MESCGGCEGRRGRSGGALAWLAITLLFVFANTAAAQPADRTFVTSDGVRLHYLLAGADHDHTIVFVPGWTMPGWIFQAQVAAFSTRYRVIAFDPRGQGQSEIADQGYDQNRRGQDIAELIGEVDPEPVVLVGWSLGVLDSLGYIARSGDSHIAGLVLVDNSVGETPAPNAAPPAKSPVRGPKRSPTCTRAFVVGMFATPQSPDYLDRLATDCGRTPAPIARALLAYPVPRTYWRDALYSTEKPVLYIVRPRLEPQALNLVRNRPNAETVLFPTAGHALFVDEPERFNDVVRDFIERRVWPSHPGAMTAAAPKRYGGALASLFLVSGASVGYEIALTRYFAVAKWSEYGYWVISIVMVGLALSGVFVTLLRNHLLTWGERWQAFLPAAIVVVGGAGYYFTTQNPFNPLELQNQVTWLPQLGYIALYYVALLPFYFLVGLYISLSFVLNAEKISLVYASDLLGAGAGAATALLLMFVLHPFSLAPALLVLVAAAALFQPRRWRLIAGAASLAALAATEAVLLFGPQPTINDFKAIYAPSHTHGAKVLDEVRTPSGEYLLLSDFAEHVDTDISNNAGMMNVPGPPGSRGFYRDGNHIAAIPLPGRVDVRYAPATLAAAPYQLHPSAHVLLVGASGGFRPGELLALGASRVDLVESEPVLHGLISASAAHDPRVRLLESGPVATARIAGAGAYNIVDISGDYLDSSDANTNDFTAEALAAYLHAVSADGIVSIPVSIRDFPAYALRMLATARDGLRLAGVAQPASHVLVYRSAWNARILISPSPWSAAQVAQVRKFADDRSFDVSYYPGINVAAARAGIYNDLPAVSFAEGSVDSTGTDDAIADEAQAVILDKATPSGDAFRLNPITTDRPFYYAILRLADLGTILKRLEILPQQEIGALVNVAVLGQAIIFALLVLATPLLAPRQVRRPGGIFRPVIYFSALGLGFLLIEIFFIEKAAFYLGDRTTAFALVLTGMLIFSGLGSMVSARFADRPRRGVILSTSLALIFLILILVGGQMAMNATIGLGWIWRAGLLLLVVAPLSVALGLSFPLGLSQMGANGMLPWAWALNGAFSVIATPAANLLAREAGLSRLLILAAGLYLVSILAFPRTPGTDHGHDADVAHAPEHDGDGDSGAGRGRARLVRA